MNDPYNGLNATAQQLELILGGEAAFEFINKAFID